MSCRLPSLLLAPLPGLVLAASPLASQQVAFSEQSAAAGLTFTHTLDPSVGMNPMVAGGAVGDFNRDGWPDVFVLGGGGVPDALFLNNGDGTFTDRAAAWGVAVAHHGAGAAVGDYDSDGWPDIYVTSHGLAGQPKTTGAHRLYHNEGNGSFTEVAAAAGVQSTTSGLPDGYSAGFGDYDLDGDLDLFVSGWEFTNHGNRLFQNNGDGTFTDVTQAAGVDDNTVKGFVPTFADMDGDLWPELIHISDAGTSRYYVNKADGTFRKLNPAPPRFDNLNGMGCAVGDLDNDADLDFYATSVYWGPGAGNALYINQGAHLYLETAAAAGVDDGGWGWGTVVLDCENDGWLDLFETNGWSTPQFNGLPSRLFLNDRDGSFTEAAVASGIDYRQQGRTVLRLDYDKDGDEDLVVLGNQAALRLYRNDGAGNHWLRLRLDTTAHPGLAPDGFGARVVARAGSDRLLRYLDGGPSYLGTSERLLHFGLGGHAVVDKITVQWPDGSYTLLGPLAADQERTVASGLPLEVPAEIHRGQQADLVVRGVQPGEYVVFVYSLAGLAPGHPRPWLGGLAFDLENPIVWLGGTNADAQGVASLPVQVPGNAPLRAIAVQAVVPRGLNGADSVKTNAVTRVVQP